MPRREGHHTVAPYLTHADFEGLIAFARAAFGATEQFRARGSAGGTHIEVLIGDSIVMIGGAAGGAPRSAMLHLYVDDVDATYARALAAGGTSIAEPQSHDDGDRRAGVADRFGNEWYIATTLA
ncbi:MAG: VOC family protein [Chloroflexales bacterium]|nr:VOC family protein [Chloroflexales bacterium]